MMFKNGMVETNSFSTLPGKYVPKLSKSGLLCKEFFWGACDSEDDEFDNDWFDGNVQFYGWGNIGHVIFLKSSTVGIGVLTNPYA